MKQSNSACTLLTVLVLVLAGREVQRTFFGDSDELAQDFTADELAGLLGFNKGTWELPELTDENYLSIFIEIDGVDQTGGGYPKDATAMEQLKGKEEVPFTSRSWISDGNRYMSWGTLGGRVTWGFNGSDRGGSNYRVISNSSTRYAEPDGTIAEYQVEDEDGTFHTIAFRFKFIKEDI